MFAKNCLEMSQHVTTVESPDFVILKREFTQYTVCPGRSDPT